MGALGNKDVRVFVMHHGYFEGNVSYEGEHYLILRNADGETTAFPWYTIGRVEVIRNVRK
jgi:hypothetical protein